MLNASDAVTVIVGSAVENWWPGGDDQSLPVEDGRKQTTAHSDTDPSM